MHSTFISNIKKRIPTDFFEVFVFDIISKVFMFVITILLIRLMSQEQYASVVKFTSLSGFLLGVFGEGISLSYIRYSTEQLSRGEKDSVGLHTICSILIISLSFVMLAFVPIIEKVYNAPTMVVIYASFYGFIMSLINMNQAYFQSRELYVKSGITNNLKNIFMLLSLVLCTVLLNELKATAVFIIYIISGLMAFIFGIIRIYKGLHPKDLYLDFGKCKSMLEDSLWIVIYLVLLNLLNQVDVVMISNMMTEEDVAMYGIAYKYYMLLLTLLPSIKAVLRVRTSKKEYIDDVKQRKDFMLNWLRKTWVFVILGCAIVILLSGIFMPILNGHQYDGSINAFRIFVIGVGLSYMFAVNTNIMMAAKRYKTLCLLALVSVIFNAIGNYIFIPTYGINGAATMTVLSQAILNISATLFIIFDKGGLEQ